MNKFTYLQSYHTESMHSADAGCGLNAGSLVMKRLWGDSTIEIGQSPQLMFKF